MADMADIVGCNAAHVHTDFFGLDRFKSFDATGEGVMDAEHESIRPPGRRWLRHDRPRLSLRSFFLSLEPRTWATAEALLSFFAFLLDRAKSLGTRPSQQNRRSKSHSPHDSLRSRLWPA